MSTVAQFATAVEVTYGTPVTPERFYEIRAGESLERRQEVIQSEGIRPGIYAPLGSRRALTRRWGEGSVTMELATTTFGRWFEHMLGGTGGVVQQGGTSAYLHTYTPGSLVGKSLTVQKGVPKTSGAAQAFTFHGCKITEWEISVAVDEYGLLTVSIDAEDVDDSTALASASYGTLKPFHFAQATLKKDTVALANVNSCRIRGQNGLKLDRYHLGTAGLKAEPVEIEPRTLDGQLAADFADLTSFYDAFEADTSLELELEFTGDNIESTYDETLTITLSDVRFTGETPKIDGLGAPSVNVPFEAFEDDSGDSITIEYMTTDTAV